MSARVTTRSLGKKPLAGVAGRSAVTSSRADGGGEGYSLASDARGNWETTHGGRVRAIGVGGAIVGTRADLIVVDDPSAEAESLLSREHTWDWWTSDLTTRLKPDGVMHLSRRCFTRTI